MPNNISKKQKKDIFFSNRYLKNIILGISLFDVILTLSLFITPFCYNKNNVIIPLDALLYEKSGLIYTIILTVLCICSAVCIGCLLLSIRYYFVSLEKYAAKVRNLVIVSTSVTALYFVGGVIFTSLKNLSNGNYTMGSGHIQLILTVITAVAFAILIRKLRITDNEKIKSTNKWMRLEFFIYGALASIFTVIACLSDIFEMTFTIPRNIDPVKINGLKLISSYSKNSATLQLLSFLIILALTVTIIFFLLSLTALISRSKLFYKLTMAEFFCAGISTLVIGVFGKYYQIVQKMNEEAILNWISQFAKINTLNIQYKIKSSAAIWFFAVILVVAVTLLRKPYTKGVISESRLCDANGYAVNIDNYERQVSVAPSANAVDPCPAFSELDAKKKDLIAERKKDEDSAFEEPSLPELVRFIVSYAGNSRLHLSYSSSDIAAFVAGLGASRLTILQGMSGTGKTSLPKIFSEAILGNCELIEVESSWRDKNELLGYYNEFTHIYTPKKFTQALYKAALDPERLTIIVLDEMNLSRVEYYFSDFLSLMEHEADKRELKLLNTSISKTVGTDTIEYIALKNGHTIRIPQNIWFVGTANRDESTFEISDKVYDRAHTMNFNKRAPRVISHSDPIPQRYLSADILTELFENAKKNVRFDIESCPIVHEVEKLLMPYNISFGNRIANQIEDFVKIYTSCFTPSEAIINEALEIILLSKVVSKLEFRNVENKELLASEFARLQLHRCSEFVLKLNED